LDLQNLARREGRQTQTLLVMYVLERFLARLATSEHADRLVLKGGMLLAVWDARRATVDADFLARNLHLDEDAVLRRVVEVASLPAPVEDGVVFRTDTATAGTIRDGDLCGGVRVTMHAAVAGADVSCASTSAPATRSRRRWPMWTTRRSCHATHPSACWDTRCPSSWPRSSARPSSSAPATAGSAITPTSRP